MAPPGIVKTTEERPMTSSEWTATHPTPPIAQEIEGQPIKKTRKPVKDDDYECLTLQLNNTQLKDQKKNSVINYEQVPRIPKKEIRQCTQVEQGQATGGATPKEGLPTGAGTGEQESCPPVREQQMGRCTIQLIRMSEESPREADRVGQLWWFTPATEVAIRDLMLGEDVTQQQCRECGFRGMKMRVRIHFCKYLCECTLTETSRDAIYDHQVSKGRSESHGGADRKIYCIDEASYPAFCKAMAWDDPPVFGETKSIRAGCPRDIEAATASTRTPLDIRARLGKQNKRPSPEPEEERESQQYPLKYRILWTPSALLKKTKECRHALGAKLQAQMALVREAMCQGRGGTTEQQCQLHAELEVMRQAYDRLSRD